MLTGIARRRNSIAAPRRRQPCLTGGREWLTSQRYFRRVLNRLHVSSALATKADGLEFRLLPLLLNFRVLHSNREYLLLLPRTPAKSSCTWGAKRRETDPLFLGMRRLLLFFAFILSSNIAGNRDQEEEENEGENRERDAPPQDAPPPGWAGRKKTGLVSQGVTEKPGEFSN